MTTPAKSTMSSCGQLQITQERVVQIVVRIIGTDGLEEARKQFKTLNDWFCTEPGWAETAAEVYAIFTEEQTRLRMEQHARELEMARAAAPNVYQVLPNAMMGLTTDGGKVGQLFMDNHGEVLQNS